ncbi:receptor protein-tyrosine kinase CEPR1-like [Magnolia sinica]|uniref:receptor protein-tyrosine kinase CEPR1-like n=1 Tax=Magnolia sinica TaxID=86752 RepID=UPI002657DA07|nr:receptor protein-tyrosine kinase CEPR1-like [Magnolia sinica]
MALLAILLSFLSLLTLSFQTPTLQNQSHFFTLIKTSLSGPSLSHWNSISHTQTRYCGYTGITCDGSSNVVEIDISAWRLVGRLPSNIFSYLPNLRILRLGYNNFHGPLPPSLLNCSLLEELNMTTSNLIGTLPDFSPLKYLRLLDLSYNLFHGEFPLSITNLSRLEVLNLNENVGLSLWQLPAEIDHLTKLTQLILSTSSLNGPIPASIGNMTSLIDLELCGNSLTGQIPVEIGKLKSLQFLELYYNRLSGEIPIELGNLTQLKDVDISVNRLTGTIPENLCTLPRLGTLQMYNNSLTGGIPPVIGNSTSLYLLSLYENSLTGIVPPNLGKFSDFIGLDLSENRLSGGLPPEICKGGKLQYLLLLDNQFSGGLPENYTNCNSVVRFRVSSNRLDGPIPDGILGLPHASIIDLGYNRFVGPVPKSIANATNLSELYIQSNWLTGSLPPEISWASNLVKVDLSNNLLSGPIPSEIGNLRKLNLLLLQGNGLVSSIPESLSSLKSLNVLNLSNNLLTGKIPESICNLLPSSLDFSNNQLSGPVPIQLIKEGLAESISGNPGLCTLVDLNSSLPSLPPCRLPNTQKKHNSIWAVAVSAAVVILGFLLFLKRWFGRERVGMEQKLSSASPSFFYDVQSFHKLSFNQHEIIEALDENNVVGHGGSGTVYKIELSNRQAVAVKKLWTRKTKDQSPDHLSVDRELKAEVETLGNIRHRNIVKLYCCFSNSDSNLLVYEYMPNGNLWDALHQAKGFLDWPTRHRIALGIAQGLAYLHHDLLPPIIHRDIKSTNILLDEDFHPKVADFGVAKVLQGRGRMDSTTTVIAGTYGYLAPEYAYSSKATTKCDVYSYGVVLMELITGKKPIEAEFGENKNIIFWISKKVLTKEGAMEVLDKRLSALFKDEMIQVLRIANRCTCSTPAHRPTMKEVVQLLIEADPSRFDAFKSWDMVQESSPTIKAKNPSDL